MHQKRLHAAQEAMVAWLSDGHELGKKPNKIECAGEFELNEMHYYIFKFKASVFGKWMISQLLLIHWKFFIMLWLFSRH